MKFMNLIGDPLEGDYELVALDPIGQKRVVIDTGAGVLVVQLNHTPSLLSVDVAMIRGEELERMGVLGVSEHATHKLATGPAEVQADKPVLGCPAVQTLTLFFEGTGEEVEDAADDIEEGTQGQ